MDFFDGEIAGGMNRVALVRHTIHIGSVAMVLVLTSAVGAQEAPGEDRLDRRSLLPPPQRLGDRPVSRLPADRECDPIWDGFLAGILPGIGISWLTIASRECTDCTARMVAWGAAGAGIGGLLDQLHCESDDSEASPEHLTISRNGSREDGAAVHFGVHAAALRGDAFSEFETRLLVGGTALLDGWRGWRPGAAIGLVWLDQEATTYVYHIRMEHGWAAPGGFEPYMAFGLGGVTTRLDVTGVEDSETSLLLPLSAGTTWLPHERSSWGVRVDLADLVVRVEEPCGCVEIGDGPTPRTGEFEAVHNLAVSAGLEFRLGGP